MKKNDNHHYQCGFTENKLFFEGYFSPEYINTIFFFPGDCFGSWAYIKLAAELFYNGINVFVLNYSNSYKSRKLPLKEVTEDQFVSDGKELMTFIMDKFDLSADKNIIHLLGHSRGANIINSLSKTIAINGKIIFDAPYLSFANGCYVKDSKLVIKLIFPLLVTGKCKLPFKDFKRRFFNDDTSNREIQEIYYKSDAIYKSTLLKKTMVSLNEVTNETIIFLHKDDKTMNLPRLSETLKQVNQRYKFIFFDGPHCEIMSTPVKLVNPIVKSLLTA
jgi:hypothetical protein